MENTMKTHWENVFATKSENEVSWYQQKPTTSLNFFINHAIPKEAKIIDVGGGDSYLIDGLLELGYYNLTVLDISENAIKRLKKRLGDKAEKVNFIISNVLDFNPKEKYDVWHDRASFHFLTLENEIIKYKSIVTASLDINGYLFLGAFSENGPLKCSGLVITQYSERKVQAVFGDTFNIMNCFTEDHLTPFDTKQNFIFTSLKIK